MQETTMSMPHTGLTVVYNLVVVQDIVVFLDSYQRPRHRHLIEYDLIISLVPCVSGPVIASL